MINLRVCLVCQNTNENGGKSQYHVKEKNQNMIIVSLVSMRIDL